jgi:hypothetical protein
MLLNKFRKRGKKMKKYIVYIFLLIVINSCGTNDYAKHQVINPDYLEIKKIIEANPGYFKSYNEKVPSTFYTYGIKNLVDIPNEPFKDRPKLLQMLERNGISQIYMCSVNEVWFVLETKEHFLKITKHMVGFSSILQSENWKIMYYKPNQIKKINGNWYSMQIDFSFVD